MHEEIAVQLGVTQPNISGRLKAMGMIRKVGYWVPYKVLLSIWWDQLGVLYHELLKRNETN